MTKKAIGSSEFKELEQQQQYDLLHRDGVYVGKRKVKDQTIVLFQLNSFYVEVYYRTYRKEIERLLSSDSLDILQPYIDQVRVRDLNNDDNTE